MPTSLHNKAASPGKTLCTFLRRVVKSPILNLEIWLRYNSFFHRYALFKVGIRAENV